MTQPVINEDMNAVYCQVSTKFMLSTLGPRAKYSCCLYPTGEEHLVQAEDYMLESYCEKAQLVDGQDVLDLGCGALHATCPASVLVSNDVAGWGSLSLFLAEVCNISSTERHLILCSQTIRNFPTPRPQDFQIRQLRKRTSTLWPRNGVSRIWRFVSTCSLISLSTAST